MLPFLEELIEFEDLFVETVVVGSECMVLVDLLAGINRLVLESTQPTLSSSVFDCCRSGLSNYDKDQPSELPSSPQGNNSIRRNLFFDSHFPLTCLQLCL